jgi:rhodanese-related sulfurtransferase
LLIGKGPLPGPSATRTGFAQLRVAHFQAALQAAGHEVRTVLLVESPRPALSADWSQVVEVAEEGPGWLAELASLADGAEVIVGAGPYNPSRAACLIAGDTPVFADLPGDPFAELQALATAPRPPVLIDARSQAEWDEGHLAGALFLPHSSTERGSLPADKSQPIVVYCAVGYRSADLAAQLLAEGHTDVKNMEGGIFGWANAGLPMIKDGERTPTAHPYDALWGRMLEAERRADVAPVR